MKVFKQVFYMVLFVLLTTPIASAVITKATGVELNSSTYTAVTIPQTNGPCRPIVVWAMDANTSVGFLMATDSTGTGVSEIPDSASFADDCVTDSAGTVLWAKSLSGTPTLYIRYGEIR